MSFTGCLPDSRAHRMLGTVYNRESDGNRIIKPNRNQEKGASKGASSSRPVLEPRPTEMRDYEALAVSGVQRRVNIHTAARYRQKEFCVLLRVPRTAQTVLLRRCSIMTNSAHTHTFRGRRRIQHRSRHSGSYEQQARTTTGAQLSCDCRACISATRMYGHKDIERCEKFHRNMLVCLVLKHKRLNDEALQQLQCNVDLR
jgi:hypothetical protein